MVNPLHRSRPSGRGGQLFGGAGADDGGMLGGFGTTVVAAMAHARAERRFVFRGAIPALTFFLLYVYDMRTVDREARQMVEAVYRTTQTSLEAAVGVLEGTAVESVPLLTRAEVKALLGLRAAARRALAGYPPLGDGEEMEGGGGERPILGVVSWAAVGVGVAVMVLLLLLMGMGMGSWGQRKRRRVKKRILWTWMEMVCWI